MKVDLNRKFRELDGKTTIPDWNPVEDEEGRRTMDLAGNFLMKRGPALTLKNACLNVLTSPPLERDDRGNPKELKAEDKLKYAELAQRIYKASGLFELNDEERGLLKKLIDKSYRAPLVFKQANEALSDPVVPEDNKKEKKH